jgi:hemoglobin
MKNSFTAVLAIAALTLIVPAAAFADDAAMPMAAPMAASPNAGATPIMGHAVYKAFHEKEGIQRIIDDFIVRVTTDPRIKARFDGANLTRLNLMLVQQVCYLTGGPCDYTGKDMKTAHQGMNLRDGDFNALAEDLQLSMDKERVPFNAQNRLLAKLAPMEHPIVTR